MGSEIYIGSEQAYTEYARHTDTQQTHVTFYEYAFYYGTIVLNLYFYWWLSYLRTYSITSTIRVQSSIPGRSDAKPNAVPI